MAELTRKDIERIVNKAWDEGKRPDLFGANLYLTDLSGMDFFEVDLVGADLQLANLSGANLWKANLSKANLSEVNLSEASLFGAKLTGANLFEAVLTEADLTGADLTGTDLTKAKLSEANLPRADLRGANLDGANLSRADLSGANLRGVNLNGANLNGANLSRTDLSGAKFSRANLSGADLSAAELSGVDLSAAVLQYTYFGDVDLSQVKGLDIVKHWGPSYIDTHTLTRSKGKIPEIFLQGVGVSNTLINYISSSADNTINHQFCFISYSSQDEAFAQHLHAGLQDKGIRCWFAPEELKPGHKSRSGTDQPTQIYDKLIVVLSKHSLKSGWVKHEVYSMLEQEEVRGKTCLYLIRLDNTVMDKSLTDWVSRVQHSHPISDFTRWKEDDAYRKAFEQLLRDLQAGK